jgi:LuxR family maltose regulon positive regulatory protein
VPLAAGGYVAPREPLSRAQFRVLGLLNLGFTTAEMATALNVTAGTVRWHLNHIFAKLHVRNRTEAIVKARESKLL